LEEAIQVALDHGIWAGLSMILIFYILKAQEKRDLRQDEREKNYQEIISSLTEKFYIIEEIKKDVEEIKENILKN
jgi:hypothetical protein